ncbi:flagellar brake protein [Undibacterium sp. Jales W-56]|uniref:flagellar brake protein n=1 Tax=Undibacterium sp. Jales W-56 TaxID=2897325 RepID=UPI0021CEFBB3|nr:flagellar brake protein [Undibacterium sp. Jales W-56]MCU6435626.1 flagellar brake protein [Undibacterium sp. Jales W-56]
MSASLSNDEIEDRYFLLGKMEILNILNDLIHRREPVTVYFNGGQEFILSMLLEARSEALIFDLGGDQRANKLLPKSATCAFVAMPDGIRVQFTGVKPNRFMWGESQAFWVPLPERIIRLQRRETYRNILPVANPLKVTLWMEDGTRINDMVLHDLSVGGFGATVTGLPSLRADDKIRHLEIPLSDKTTLICSGQVRHVTLISRDGHRRYRIGVKFFKLPHAMEVAIQRYIIKTEYERRKLLMI